MFNNDQFSQSDAANQFDRVREHTVTQINAEIDQKIVAKVREYASQSEATITQRIQDLEREWDTERVLEANASTLAFISLLLGIFVNHHWFWLTGIVLPFLFQHAVQGWCPPLPVIRRLGVRTRNEIDQEKYALKALRGDFAGITANDGDRSAQVNTALQAVKA